MEKKRAKVEKERKKKETGVEESREKERKGKKRRREKEEKESRKICYKLRGISTKQHQFVIYEICFL